MKPLSISYRLSRTVSYATFIEDYRKVNGILEILTGNHWERLPRNAYDIAIMRNEELVEHVMFEDNDRREDDEQTTYRQ